MNEDYVLDVAPFPPRGRIGIKENRGLIEKMKSVPNIPSEGVLLTNEEVTAAISKSCDYEFRRVLRLQSETSASTKSY